MEKSNSDILSLLQRIDKGYVPNKAESRVLAERVSLNLSGTTITELPESIGRLTALESLDLTRAKITKLPESIGRLTALKRLDLTKTGITELPESIGQLTALESLDLYRTEITELPKSIGRLTALKSLDLWHTHITELPESIGRLTALESLDLGNTLITKLPKSIVQLRSLRDLHLSGSELRIRELPESIKSLSKLEELLIWRTKITELPEWIGELPSLRYLDLEDLTLERIPRSLALKGLPFVAESTQDRREILVRGTKLLTQDISVFLDTPELIPSLYDEEQVIVPECKVIFLGNGEAGKTYTIRRIENEGAEETEEDPYKTKETPGVEISDYRVKDSKGDFKIHFWDFGGQDILHSMHRCFLTDNTCYAVMVKTRETNPDSCARFWLRNVKAFAPNSPVLLFINLWDDDDGLRVIDETRLKKDYPNIKKIVYCSAKKASQKEFREKVMNGIIGMAEGYRDEMRTIPASFDSVRREIIKENETKDILDRIRYREICEASGVEDAEAPALLTYLNRLGVCFSYHLNAAGEELKNYKLLKPIWLTNAIYAIIKEGAANATEGRIPIASVRQMLVNPAPEIVDGKQYTRTAPIRYKRNEPDYVLAVAEAYSLCYRVDENLLFFPALCPTDSPKEALEEPEGFPCHAEYRFMYEYLPDSVVHKLMIRLLKKDLNVQHCWHDGMVVGCWDEHRIIIRMVDDDRTLRIDFYSKEGASVCEAFPLIREEIIAVNNALGLKANEFIADSEDEFTLIQLIKSFKRGVRSIIGQFSGNDYDPGELLRRFFDLLTVSCMEPDGEGSFRLEPQYKFHKQNKNDAKFRSALRKVYNKKCAYCGDYIKPAEMQVDHILASNYEPNGDIDTINYLAELRKMGFDTKKPDYIENYLPSCGHCNRQKTNHLPTASSLRFYHNLAMINTPKVLAKIEALKNDDEQDSEASREQ